MRRWLKRIGLVLLVLVVLGALLFAHTAWFKPLRIGWFYERVFLEYALDDPELLSRIRVLEPLGLSFHNDDLTDASPARDEALRRKLNADYAMLKRYDTSGMDTSERLSYDILEYFLGLQVRGEPYARHNFPVNQLFGVQSSLPSFLADVHQIKRRADAADYISRLGKVGIKFDQVIEGLKERETLGILPPRFTVEKVIAQMQAFRATPIDENVLHTSFRKRIDEAAAGEFSDIERKQLEDAVSEQIGSVVYPAYDALIAYFQRLQVKVTRNDGAWRLPDGEAFYAFAVEMHTTTRAEPETLHQTGLSEVARIQAQMDLILRTAGYADGSVGARMQALGKDPAQLYPDTDAGRAQILADFKSIIEEIDSKLEPYFDVRPAAGVEVRRVPEFSEKTAPGAYYQSPAMDGSRPGVFYLNLRNVDEIARFGMRTLAYHEAVPGHHFQLSVMQELKGVPTFRRLVPFTAYSEGWALYTEQLAYEAGFQAQPLDNLGRLQAELFRAVRLVVDTGMHAKRWTREQAIAYMIDNTGMPESYVTAEIERYLVNPGQALAYKVGMMKILELRERARSTLGSRFDIRGFHNVVLTGGAMPLAILERRVEAWIADQAPRQ